MADHDPAATPVYLRGANFRQERHIYTNLLQAVTVCHLPADPDGPCTVNVMTSVLSVAQRILDQCGTMETCKLQKLCYYVQGVHVARTGSEAFTERIKAGADGPVVPQLYHEHKGQRYVSQVSDAGGVQLPPDLEDSIALVLSLYGSFDGDALSVTACAESPWRNARSHTPPGEPDGTSLSKQDLKEYFTAELAEIGTVRPPMLGETFVGYLSSQAK